MDATETKNLIDLAIKAKETSYSPYSKFRVGCVLKTKGGKIYTGCNVENASYGLTICAERTAFVKAISEGEKSFSTVVVTSDLADQFITPCGACRQFMIEFGQLDVVLTKADGSYKIMKITELLPLGFTPADLNGEQIQQ